jgi:hypothetical protein
MAWEVGGRNSWNFSPGTTPDSEGRLPDPPGGALCSSVWQHVFLHLPLSGFVLESL